MVSGAERWLTRSLRDLVMDVQVEAGTDLGRHDPKEIAGADLILVGGGNTFQLLDHLRRHGHEQVVRDFVAEGGDFYGGSAGAIRACSNIRIAGEYDTNDAGRPVLGIPGRSGSLFGVECWRLSGLLTCSRSPVPRSPFVGPVSGGRPQ